jgi:hypothetical protein
VERPEQPSDRPQWEPPAGSGQYQPPGAGGPQPPPGFYSEPARQQQRTPGNAVASLVLGILGFLVCPIICSVLAIVFGQQAKGQIERDPNLTGAGPAQAGYIMGIVGLVLGGLAIAFWTIAIAASG